MPSNEDAGSGRIKELISFILGAIAKENAWKAPQREFVSCIVP